MNGEQAFLSLRTEFLNTRCMQSGAYIRSCAKSMLGLEINLAHLSIESV